MQKGLWSMERILITGSSNTVTSQVERHLDRSGALQKVTAFYDNYNFLLTQYELLSPWVHMVLEFENLELQIEAANCGYRGGGPSESVRLMEMLGLSKEYAEPLFFGHRALSFDLNNGVPHCLNTYQLFYSGGRVCCYKKSELVNKIVCDGNVEVVLQEKKVRFYNPQRTNWRGFINLLAYMDNIKMEYYIGENSPLDRGLYFGGDFGDVLMGRSNPPDIKGAPHSNLYLRGDNFNISCFIDRQCEIQVIEAVHLALTGKPLFERQKISWKSWMKKIFSHKEEKEIFKVIMIKDTKGKM